MDCGLPSGSFGHWRHALVEGGEAPGGLRPAVRFFSPPPRTPTAVTLAETPRPAGSCTPPGGFCSHSGEQQQDACGELGGVERLHEHVLSAAAVAGSNHPSRASTRESPAPTSARPATRRTAGSSSTRRTVGGGGVSTWWEAAGQAPTASAYCRRGAAPAQ